MKGEPKQLIQDLSLRYFGVLALVAALLLVDQAVFQPMLIQLNGYGPVINLAGRQRMLSQRMTKAVLAIEHDPQQTQQRLEELQESLESWLQVHHGLQFGDTNLQLPGTNVEPIVSAFKEIDPHVREMTSEVQQVVADSTATRTNVNNILLHEEAFLAGMDEIVGVFEREAASQVTRLRWLGVTATLLVLALMVGLAKLVVQPASDYIRTQVQQLTASEERFRLLVERMNDGLAVFDFEGRLTYVNRRFSQMLLMEPERLVGSQLQKFLSGMDLRLFLQLLSQVLPSPEIARELRWELPNGQERVTLAAFGTTHVIGAEGNLDGANQQGGLSFLVVTDISELKHAEEELRHARDVLEVRVAERTQELTKANEALAIEATDREAAEERNRLLQTDLAQATRVTTLGQFATGIAHEINQPLGAIANYADTMSLQIETGNSSNDSLIAMARRIQNSALRAGEIVRRMRNFLKPKPMHKSEELINDLVKEVLDLCSPEIRLHQVEVDCDLTESQQLRVLVDAIQIQQVLVNLINNAVQAMVETDQPRTLTIRTESHQENVFVFVEDHGPGFATEIFGEELSPFQTTKSEGLGMGLSISNALISAHGGELWIDNSAQGGARVGFSLTTIRNSDTHVQSDHICR